MQGGLFAQNVRKHRRKRGLTQSALGQMSGYTQGHISNLERGVLAPSMAVLEQLASAMGIAPAELLIVEEHQMAGRRGNQRDRR